MSLTHFLIRFYKDLNKQKQHQNDKESEFIPESVELLYYFQKIYIRRPPKSYIKSPDWLVNKGATINSRNEKDKCFQWSTILGLNYNKIKEKDLKKVLKIKRIDTDFSLYPEDW